MSTVVAAGKVPFPIDEAAWHPSLLPGRLIERRGAERLARSGLTLLPARVVAAPLVAECPGQLAEGCTYEPLAPLTRIGARE